MMASDKVENLPDKLESATKENASAGESSGSDSASVASSFDVVGNLEEEVEEFLEIGSERPVAPLDMDKVKKMIEEEVRKEVQQKIDMAIEKCHNNPQTVCKENERAKKEKQPVSNHALKAEVKAPTVLKTVAIPPARKLDPVEEALEKIKLSLRRFYQKHNLAFTEYIIVLLCLLAFVCVVSSISTSLWFVSTYKSIELIHTSSLACIGQQVLDLDKDNGDAPLLRLPLRCLPESSYYQEIKSTLSVGDTKSVIMMAQGLLASNNSETSVVVNTVMKQTNMRLIVEQLEHMKLLPHLLTGDTDSELTVEDSLSLKIDEIAKQLDSLEQSLSHYISPVGAALDSSGTIYKTSASKEEKISSILTKMEYLGKNVLPQKNDPEKVGNIPNSKLKVTGVKEALFEAHEFASRSRTRGIPVQVKEYTAKLLELNLIWWCYELLSNFVLRLFEAIMYSIDFSWKFYSSVLDIKQIFVEVLFFTIIVIMAVVIYRFMKRMTTNPF